jgi:hypothetical protein
LNSIRSGKFALEIAGIIGSVALGIWTGGLAAGLIVAPLSASVIQMLTDFFGAQYVDFHREQTRSRQQALVTQHLSSPLGHWLTQWPTTGGSAYERLQRVLQRFPDNVQQLHAAVNAVSA